MYNELLRQKESVLSLRRGAVQDLQKWNGRRTILKDGLVVDPENERKDQLILLWREILFLLLKKCLHRKRRPDFGM